MENKKLKEKPLIHFSDFPAACFSLNFIYLWNLQVLFDFPHAPPTGTVANTFSFFFHSLSLLPSLFSSPGKNEGILHPPGRLLMLLGHSAAPVLLICLCRGVPRLTSWQAAIAHCYSPKDALCRGVIWWRVALKSMLLDVCWDSG